MKSVKITFYVSLIVLSFAGCSSTYKVSGFSSKEKFYDDFNKSVNGKIVEITLSNDSSFTAFEDVHIANDSLHYISQIKKEEIKIRRSEIKDVKYVGSNMESVAAVITLKNGKAAIAKNASMLSDSIFTVVISTKVYEAEPLHNVLKISYKNHWLGAPFGLIGGSVVSLFSGLFISGLFYDNSQNNAQKTESVYLGIWGIGTLAGAIWGWIHGYEYTYQFNP